MSLSSRNPPQVRTHLALTIGNKALECGYKVFFASMDTLMHILKTQEISRASAARVKWIKEVSVAVLKCKKRAFKKCSFVAYRDDIC